MLIWSMVLIVISIVLMLGNFIHNPFFYFQILPVVTLLASLGILYRVFYKSRRAEREKFAEEIERLREELEEVRGRLTDNTEN